MNDPPVIVVVEDDEDDFLLIRDGLLEDPRTPDYKLKWHIEAPQSAATLLEDKPDILIIDYRLGAKTGIQLASEFREFDQTAGIILLTGMGDEEFDDISFQSGGIGISDFLSKRNLSSLSRSVRFALESSRQREAIRNQSQLLEDVLETGKSALRTEDIADESHLFFSESIESLTGFSKAELESRSVLWLDRVAEEDRDGLLNLQESLDNTEQQSTYRFLRKDGTLIWIQETTQVRVTPEDRSRLQISGYLQDFTHRHEREANIHLMASSLEQSSEAVIITDSQLEAPGPQIVYVNKAAERMTGYDKTELIGQSPRILQGPKTDRRILDDLKKDCLGGNEFSATTVNYRKDGSEYFVRWKIRPIRDNAGKISNFISTQRDVTDEHEARLESERNQNFLKEIGEMVRVGGWRLDLNPTRLSWTDQVYKIHGVEPGTPVPLEDAFAFYSENSREKIKAAVEKCIWEAIPFDLVLSFRNSQGEDLWVRAKGEPSFKDSQIVAVWGIFQDVTELQNMRHQTEVFYNLAVDLSCIVSKDGRFIELNERWESVLGYTVEELSSMGVWDLVHPDDVAGTRQALEEGLQVGHVYNFENRWRHKNGNLVHFLWNAVRSPDGNAVFALARDVTELKEKETMLEDALLKANLANQAKNQFLMVMSHEMRTPLNPILGFADLLLEEIEDPDHRMQLEQIKSSAKHMASLISDVLDISSIEAGRVKLLHEPADIIRVVRSSIAYLESKAEDKGLTLTLNDNGFEQAEPRLVCLVDKLKIRQTLLNLVSNAIKFTRSGSVTVEFSKPVLRGNSADLCIKVIDTGIGIPEDELESVFERFYQVSMTSSREFEGQGLGLALSRQLARCMGGDVTVESDLGKGSVFSFSFGAEVVSGLESIERPDANQAHAGAGNLTRDFKVLFVEDDAINQMVLKGILTRLGVSFRMATNGVEALEIVNSHDFDVILMDIQMPEMDGIEATRRIRAGNTSNTDIPIFAVSAHAINGIKKAGLDAGMNAFLEKPVSLEVITEALERVAGGVIS